MKAKPIKSTGKVRLFPDKTGEIQKSSKSTGNPNTSVEVSMLHHTVWALEQVLIDYSGAAGLGEEGIASLRAARLAVLKLALVGSAA